MPGGDGTPWRTPWHCCRLTGGYASSYAQTASQQAYDRYMQELAELMPELESSARQRDQDQA